MAGVYWVGADGNKYVKAEGVDGVVTLDQAGKQFGDRGDLYGLSRLLSGLTEISDPARSGAAVGGGGGSALTAYAWDSANEEIEINESGSTWSAKDLYAWYKYYITTATGIDEVFGRMEAKDAGNIELGDVKLDNLDSNSLAPEDDIRVYRSDDTWIVRNPTTGGGDLGVYSTGTIYVKNINTATNVITGDISDLPTSGEIADAVWDEALSGHTTAGTAGKVIADTEANTDVTQAKVDQL